MIRHAKTRYFQKPNLPTFKLVELNSSWKSDEINFLEFPTALYLKKPSKIIISSHPQYKIDSSNLTTSMFYQMCISFPSHNLKVFLVFDCKKNTFDYIHSTSMIHMNTSSNTNHSILTNHLHQKLVHQGCQQFELQQAVYILHKIMNE